MRLPLLLPLALGAGFLMPGAMDPAEASLDRRWRQGIFPVAQFQTYTSHYGMRRLNGGQAQVHHGLDIAAPLGSEVRSWWSGRVLEVIQDGICGNGLVIGSGAYEHIYCHLGGTVHNGKLRSGGISLQKGHPVRFGQAIGHIGMTGRTTGPHLHWGLRYGGRWLDPARILRAMAASRAGT